MWQLSVLAAAAIAPITTRSPTMPTGPGRGRPRSAGPDPAVRRSRPAEAEDDHCGGQPEPEEHAEREQDRDVQPVPEQGADAAVERHPRDQVAEHGPAG